MGLMRRATIPSAVLAVPAILTSHIAAATARLYVNVSSVGNVGAGEDDLMSYTMPAETMNVANRGVRIIAWGTTAANSNQKTINLYFGATILRMIGPVPSNNTAWRIEATILRVTETTQKASGTSIVGTNPNSDVTAPVEDLSTDTLIKVTGEGTVNDDVLQEGMIIQLL